MEQNKDQVGAVRGEAVAKALDGLTLYEPSEAEIGEMESGRGDWLKYSDVVALLARAADALDSQPTFAEGWVLAKETVIEMPNGKKELGYTLMEGVGIFTSFDEVAKAIKELSLPLGWVGMTTLQLLPGWQIHEAPASSQPTDLPDECSDEMYHATTHICNLLEREDVNAMWRAMREVVLTSSQTTDGGVRNG